MLRVIRAIRLDARQAALRGHLAVLLALTSGDPKYGGDGCYTGVWSAVSAVVKSSTGTQAAFSSPVAASAVPCKMRNGVETGVRSVATRDARVFARGLRDDCQVGLSYPAPERPAPRDTRSPNGANNSYLFCQVVYMIPLAPGVASNSSIQPFGFSSVSPS